jgi:hypothetical protein
VVLWTSHILIRHDAVKDSSVSFDVGQRRWELPAASRTRAQAHAIARDLSERARRAPQMFPELALQFSEDPATRDRGGSLGGVTAFQFILEPRLLDMFAAVEIGGVSRVIETRHGFHVFWRRTPPPAMLVSGARIVIGHRDSPWLRHSARRAVPDRSRDEALQVATEIYERARSNPDDFDNLAEQYSERVDATPAGDIGTWSSLEPTPFPLEVEILQSLAVGEVAAPLDSGIGVEIIRRTPNRARTQYSIEEISLGFKRGEPDALPGSRAAVQAQVRLLQARLAANPSIFGALQQQYCCERRTSIIEGRGQPRLVAVLQVLQPGEVSKTAVDLGSHFSILALQATAEYWPEATARFELPSPAGVDLDAVVQRSSWSVVAAQLEAVADAATARLALDQARLRQLRDVQAAWEDCRACGASERLARFNALLRGVQEVLDPERYAGYQALLREQFERAI